MVKKNQKNLQDIIDVVQRLRHPKKGCPWDIEQTSKTLSKYTLEEAYEVVEAIEKNNYIELEDELGDLLLQVIYHSVIAAEKKNKGANSILDGVSVSLPAVTRSLKLQKRAAKEGFDWKKPEDTLKKVREELNELAVEMKDKNKKKMREELGDLLFSCINLSRKLGIDTETVIRESNRKFEKRFRKMEKQMNKKSLKWELKNLEKEWQNSK